MEKRYISKEGLDKWFNQIIQSNKHVFAPVQKGEKVDFKRVGSLGEVASDYIQTTQSIKRVVFPKSEVLFSYKKEGNEMTLQDFDPNTVPESVLWNIHPCDAAGFNPLTGIFNWDYKDKLYNARLEKTTLVSFSCQKCDKSCFCTSVNGGPGNTAGSDIQITKLPEGGALVEIFTPKGEALVALAPDCFEADRDIKKEDYLADVPVRFKVDELIKKLDGSFDSPIWKEQSERCLGCGACAFVCPTCACFDIQEDPKGSTGRRIRCWDSCGFAQFTLHTSGHNPRSQQSQRWRQRILHKFSYMPERIHETGCTGCGRCSRACPVDMNILEHLTSIAQQSHE